MSRHLEPETRSLKQAKGRPLLLPFLCGALALIALCGCKTQTWTVEDSVRANPHLLDGTFREYAIYEKLSREPIPLPQTTPYDSDGQKRAAYVTGFLDAWHNCINSTILKGIVVGGGMTGSPDNWPQDLARCWSEGWLAGASCGAERLMRELHPNITPSASTNSTREVSK